MNTQRHAKLRRWVSHRLDNEVERTIRRLAQRDDVRHVVVLPDVHLAEHTCVGTACATTELVYPDAIGGDIGCGMSEIAIDMPLEHLREHELDALYARWSDAIPIHRRRAPVDALPDALGSLSDDGLDHRVREAALISCGTLGTGNHFLELQRDRHEPDRFWIMVHSGSRAVGQMVHQHHAQAFASPMSALSMTEEAGVAYFNDMQWARAFAALNRRTMLDAATRALCDLSASQVDQTSFIDNDHNHISREMIGDQALLIHRKGAQRADAGREGVIPGSMGTMSVRVVGRGDAASLHSCSHGCGRVMARREARRRVSTRQLRDELSAVHMAMRPRASLCEEAPSAYKDIRDVLRCQRDLVRVTGRMDPIMTMKGAR